jgi:hypothetical protein
MEAWMTGSSGNGDDPQIPDELMNLMKNDWAPFILMIRDMQSDGATPVEIATLMASLWISASNAVAGNDKT